MPDVYRFELVQRGTVTDTHDLLSQMRVVAGSWRETQQGNRIVTTCTLAKQETAANIRSTTDDLRTFLRRAFEYVNDTNSLYECWYRWQTSGESEKRSLVYSYGWEPIDAVVEDIHLDSGTGRYLLTFSRDVAFEEVGAQTATSSALSSVGGRWDLTSTITGGDIDGRIEKLIIKPTMSSNNFYRAWVGIRPPRYGIGPTSYGFNPTLDFLIEHIAGGLYPTYISLQSTGSYYGGYFLRDNFGNGADLSIKFSYGLGNSEYYVGSYLVLLRAKNAAGSTVCSARIGTSFGGYSAGAYAKPIALGNTQYIDDTNWRYYEMGIIDIPGGRSGHIQSVASFNINLETGRASGSASLDVDCLVLIPAEHYVTWSAAEYGRTASSSGGIGNAYIYTQPDGSVDGLVINTSGAPSGVDGYAEEYAELGAPAGTWAYPYEGGCLVFAAERETAQTVADTASLEVFIKRRWGLYRT